ncbi:MAG: helicase C-terminal domain-containing protein, partial [Halobacteriaceae archaeon]
CQTLTSARFVQEFIEEGDKAGKYPVLGVRRNAESGDVYGRAELFTCIPRDVTSELFESIYSSVLMSATLRPFDVTCKTLGISDPKKMAFDLAFPQENRRTLAVDTPPLFSSNRDDPEVQGEILDTLEDAIKFTAGNVLVFFPSYGEAERYGDRLSDVVDRPVFLDQAGESADVLRESFIDQDRAVLCTSLWGTLTEGVSFDGDDARAVCVVGVPYPRLDDRSRAIQDSYDAAFEGENSGWQYAIEIPTVRKTRQAMGRILRSPEDIGVRLLLDRRYTARHRDSMGKYSVRDSFPSKEREEIVDIDSDKVRYALSNFFTDQNAWTDTPPRP